MFFHPNSGQSQDLSAGFLVHFSPWLAKLSSIQKAEEGCTCLSELLMQPDTETNRTYLMNCDTYWNQAVANKEDATPKHRTTTSPAERDPYYQSTFQEKLAII